jgi:hypothetical protein
VVLAADLEARRVGEHAADLVLAGRGVPVPAPPTSVRSCGDNRVGMPTSPTARAAAMAVGLALIISPAF